MKKPILLAYKGHGVSEMKAVLSMDTLLAGGRVLIRCAPKTNLQAVYRRWLRVLLIDDRFEVESHRISRLSIAYRTDQGRSGLLVVE